MLPKLLVLKLLAMVAFAFTVRSSPDIGGGENEANATFVRVDASTGANIEKVLALYAYGQEIIKGLNCTDPASQYYQGAMHGIPAPSEMAGGVDRNCPAHTDTPMRGFNSCPHFLPTEIQLNFLTWHRLYLYYFEKNFRYYLANGGSGLPGLGTATANEFSIPYWDYTNEGQLPPIFREASVGVDPIHLDQNPLFEIGRSPALMAGDPIDCQAMSNITVNVDGNLENLCVATMGHAIDYNKFLVLPDVSEFSRALEGRMHNLMHHYIGGGVEKDDQESMIYNRIYGDSQKGRGMMLLVESAGFDPIFFLHHSNIDRMFSSWERVYGPITVEDMDTYAGNWDSIGDIYQFWDVESGVWITYDSMQEMLDAAHAIDYTYEYFPDQNEAFRKERGFDGKNLLHEDAIDIPVRLTNEASSHSLPISLTGFKEQEARYRYTVEVDLKLGLNTFQQLVAFAVPPDFDWNSCKLDDDYVFGVNSFFGATQTSHFDHGAHESTVPGQEFSQSIVFDVTKAAVEKFGNGEDLTIFFAPLNSQNGPDFFIHAVRFYEQKPESHARACVSCIRGKANLQTT